MRDFDEELKSLLSEEDRNFIGDTIDETGYYKYAWNSFRGPGSGMRLLAWGGILTFGVLTILFVILMMTTESARLLIIFAAFAIMMNSAQIALKLWFNMQLNRVALSRELRRLQLIVAAQQAD